MDHAVTLLKAALAEHLAWHGARLTFLALFLLALFKVKSVNLAELAQVASHYKRLQRFFRAFTLDYEVLARLLVRLFPVGEGPWYLTLERTNWKFGKTDLNFLILGIAHSGMALPVLWTVLDKPGNSDTEERIALPWRFLADRGFIGEDWVQWLQAQGIPFYLRLKRNTLIPNAWKVPMRAEVLFQSLKPGRTRHLESQRPIWRCFVPLSALRRTDGDFLILTSSSALQHEAFTAYSHR